MLSLAGTRPERWTRCQRARAHTKSGAERRRHVAQHVAAAGTAAVIADRAGGVGAQPVAASFALRIDALDGETGQILHILSSPSGGLRRRQLPQTPYRPKKQNVGANCGAGALWCQEETPQYMGVRLRMWKCLGCPPRSGPKSSWRIGRPDAPKQLRFLGVVQDRTTNATL